MSFLYLQQFFLVCQPTIEVFSLLAISTSYIGFVLGLADFLSDCRFLKPFGDLAEALNVFF
jgi:hypothetical protein